MSFESEIRKTPIPWVIAAIASVSVPLGFLSQWGWTWFFLLLATGSSAWWWIECVKGREVRFSQETTVTVHTWRAVLARAFIPIAFIGFFVVYLWMDFSSLNLWRKPYGGKYVGIERHGSIHKHFGFRVETTASERESRNRNHWIRWMADGVNASNSDVSLLFVEGESFQGKYHTFNVEVHNNGTKVLPDDGCAAFLVVDEPGDPWYRPTYRQIPCEPAGDGSTRLFRATVRNAGIGEKLWLFLAVAPRSRDVVSSLDDLDLELLVQP